MDFSNPRSWALGLCFWAGVAAIAPAQQLASPQKDPALQLEMEYVQGLYELQLPDYATLVLDRLKAKYPQAGPEVKALELRGRIEMGKFDEVKAIIAKQANPESEETWAMRLALADGFYAWGKFPEARAIYDAFFKKYPTQPPQSLNDFFMRAAYKYAQMLQLTGDTKGAIDAYKISLRAKLDKQAVLQINAEMAELMLKLATTASKEERAKWTAQAEKIANDVLLWDNGLWFGRGVGIKAHVLVLNGNADGARDLIEDYTSRLRDIDDALKEQARQGEDLTRLSPMAQCRYLIGSLLEDRARKILAENGDKQEARDLLIGKVGKNGKRSDGAYQHLINVFIGYPATGWAPDAGVRAHRIEATLRDVYGIRPKLNVTREQREAVEKCQFQNARAIFAQNQFEQAAEEYAKVLTMFHSSPSAVVGLGDLGACYIELQDDLYVDVVVHYLGERFGRHETLAAAAGDQVLRLSMMYQERKQPTRKQVLQEAYYKYFPGHPRVPGLLFSNAERQFTAGDFNGALGFYRQIEKSYTNSPLYFDALSRIATCYGKLEDRTNEITALERYLTAVSTRQQPGHAFVNGKYRLAGAYRQADPKFLPTAYNRYNEVVNLLTANAAQYQKNAEETENNQKILEGALFFRAEILARLPVPQGQPENSYKEKAAGLLQEFLVKFPKSQMAPSVLMQMGVLHTIMGHAQEAENAFTRLKKEYPDSPISRDSVFLRGMALLKIDRRQEAISEFKKMFKVGGNFSDAQRLTAGTELLKAREFEIALEAFDSVLATAKTTRALREPAMLGRGKALIELGRFAEGASTLDELLRTYQRSGYTVEAASSASRAYSEVAQREPDANKRIELFNKAVEAEKTVRKFVTNNWQRAESNLRVARIQERKAKGEEQHGKPEKAKDYRREAIATYQLIMMAEAGTPEMRKTMDDAFGECIQLLVQIEEWEDAAGDCERYLELFERGGKHVLEVRQAQARAKAGLARQASTPPAPAPAPKGGPADGGGDK